jgi:hypothetical protein
MGKAEILCIFILCHFLLTLGYIQAMEMTLSNERDVRRTVVGLMFDCI